MNRDKYKMLYPNFYFSHIICIIILFVSVKLYSPSIVRYFFNFVLNNFENITAETATFLCLFIGYLLYFPILIVVILTIVRRNKDNYKKFFIDNNNKIVIDIINGLLLGIVISFFLFLISPHKNMDFIYLGDTSQIFIIALVTSAKLVNSIIEEVTTRLFFYQYFKYKMNIILGILITNLLFALYHYNYKKSFFAWFISPFIAGLCFNIIYERSRSIIPALAAHFSVGVSLWFLNTANRLFL